MKKPESLQLYMRLILLSVERKQKRIEKTPEEIRLEALLNSENLKTVDMGSDYLKVLVLRVCCTYTY